MLGRDEYIERIQSLLDIGATAEEICTSVVDELMTYILELNSDVIDLENERRRIQLLLNSYQEGE